MAEINFSDLDMKYMESKIKKVLLRRKMIPDFNNTWEVHGPHQYMNYEIYVGYAFLKEDKSMEYCVVIYPNGVWEIDDPSDWNKLDPERRIIIK